MRVQLADFMRDTPGGEEAAAILRKCVHCGFCNAVCPTYQLLGNELDGPRGRIYLIKQALEGQPVGARTQLHLDRCLTCLACETACPSGVEYGRLLSIGREVVEQRVPRGKFDALRRRALRELLPRPRLFGPAVSVGRLVKPLLPSALADKLPPEPASGFRPWPVGRARPRRVLLLAGCVQPSLAPNINAALARVLDKLEIQALEVERAGCCGALRHHLTDRAAALDDARRNIDAWWPEIEAGVEAIVSTASGCGVHLREYGYLLCQDRLYVEKARRVSALCRDPSELLAAEAETLQPVLRERRQNRGKLAYHAPCSLQHGLRIRGVVEGLLAAAGFELVPVAESHLCCGSAGTYSVLQPELSGQLRDKKLAALSAGCPQRIATANIGCLAHLQAGSATPVVHWIELMDEVLS